MSTGPAIRAALVAGGVVFNEENGRGASEAQDAMKKLDMDDVERALENEMASLSTDEHGNEIFVGLDVAESVWVWQYRKDVGSEEGQNNRRADKKHYWALYEKHERARIKVVGAIIERDAFKPTRN